MAKTVVGLFDSASDAQNVLSDLQNIGFGSSDAELITGSAFSGDESDVINRLSTEGVPADDARLYSEGVRNGGALVVARTDDRQVNDVVDIMNRHNIVDLDSRRGSYSQVDTDQTRISTSTSGVSTTGTSTSGVSTTGTSYTDTTRSADYGTSTGSRSTIEAGENVAVPIVEEELRVGTRETERGGVRVETRIEETPVEEQVTLRDETVRVERRPASGASTADLNAFQEGTFEVRETDEEAIVDKQARVVEEVVISKDVDQRTETISDTVRRTDVDVQEVGGSRTSATTDVNYGTTDTTTGQRDRTLTDRIEGATGLDVDRDNDVDGRRNV